MKIELQIKNVQIKKGFDELHVEEINASMEISGKEVSEVLKALPKKVWKEVIKTSNQK